MSALPRTLLVLGLGRSGLAAARLAAADGAAVRVSDLRSEAELAEVLAGLPETEAAVFGSHPESLLAGLDAVVVSPGVPSQAPVLAAARKRGVLVLSEVEYAWMHRPEAPLVAITGSNGKSTVTVLVAEILREAGLNAVAGGNLGTAASEMVLDDTWQAWVLEVSSFQTEIFTRLRPQVAVFLNLSQDHLERHPQMASYCAAKRRLFVHQGAEDVAVLNRDDPASAATETSARRLFFSVNETADGWLDGDRLVVHGEPLLQISEMALAGRHNAANALAATLAAEALGAPLEAAAAALRRFSGLDHRHRTVQQDAGVTWVDDSKATNVGATLAGLSGYPAGSVHLILGGQGKGQDFSVLGAEVARAAARVYLIGEDAELIAAALGEAAPLESCGTLEEAVARARSMASAGQWVLLAPACASFDQFTSYGERGERFAALAREGGAACR